MATKSGSWLRAAGQRTKRQTTVVRAETRQWTSPRDAATAASIDTDDVTHTPPAATKDTTDRLAGLKDMSELPGPPGWPVIGNFLTYLKKENQGKIHHVQARYHKKFGSIFREKWGPKWQVHISDPSLIEHVYRNQGITANRPGIQAWSLYREINDIPNGILTSQGDTWRTTRQKLEKKLLSTAECNKLHDPVYDVTTDLVSRLEFVAETEGDEALAKSIPNEFYKWGVECAGVLLFDRRLGCLDNQMAPEPQQFVDAFNKMFDTSMKLIVGEKIQQRLNTRIWQEHTAAWDQIFGSAKKYIQERLDRHELEKEAGLASSACPFGDKSKANKTMSSYLLDVIASGQFTLQEMFTNFSEIMVAGTDTTSNTLCFILQLLAENPEVQERLREEIDAVRGEIGDANPVGKMSYLDNVIKETLRLYPLASMQCRLLDNDLDLAGHRIPKNTLLVLNHYATCHNPEVFEDPEEFRPERWDRGTDMRLKHHPFASMPFGYGTRTCLGKRFARLELHLALSKILKRFEVQLIPDMPFEPIVRTLLTPGKQVPVRFAKR